MKITVTHETERSDSYRAERIRSLFNCENGHLFHTQADLPVEKNGWKIGAIIGPSGSGKTSLGRKIWGPDHVADLGAGWPKDKPIIDAITPDGPFDAVPAALSAVGLGSVPSWLRPYHILSTGEQFRAGLARLIAQPPEQIVIDEFTSVVDRQIARIGAGAFAKAWRRHEGKVVVLSCHRDFLDWLEPDWVYDTNEAVATAGRGLWQRPKIELTIEAAACDSWRYFEPHHYLKLPHMIAATHYIGRVGAEPVAHVAVSTQAGLVEARACRLVILPEWQGAGVGLRFLNAVCDLWWTGQNRYGIKVPTLFHTSHPNLAASLRRHKSWVQVTCRLYGVNKVHDAARSRAAAERLGRKKAGAGFGGHFRAAQGFRYWGPEGLPD